MPFTIRVLVRACLLATSVIAQTMISEQGQPVMDIAEISRGPGPSTTITILGTTMTTSMISGQMTSNSTTTMSTATTSMAMMSSGTMTMMPNGVFPNTMTMIQGGETVVEVVSTDSSGDIKTQILSTILPTSTPSGNQSRHAAAIAGGAVSGVVTIGLVVTALLLCRRRNREQPSNGEMFMVEPADYKPSIDSMRPMIGQPANTVPTPLTYGADGQRSTYLSSVAPQTGITASTDPDQPTPVSSKQEAARQQRQRELELQMRYLQDEMRALGPGPGPSLALSPERAEDARQIEMMREQIALLQAQQQSSWAQGLTDEPLPGYTADTVVNRVATPES